VNYLAKGARLSACGTYRYSLTREWSRGLSRRLIVIGLNPSTADAELDDPTIRRCVSFATREGCGGLLMLNLFAFRATNPAELANAADPIGPDNDHEIQNTFWTYDVDRGTYLAAWGAHAMAVERARDLMLLWEAPRLFCLGKTKEGHPRHPLYVPGTQPLESFGLADLTAIGRPQ
jgi:hypothetical protein